MMGLLLDCIVCQPILHSRQTMLKMTYMSTNQPCPCKNRWLKGIMYKNRSINVIPGSRENVCPNKRRTMGSIFSTLFTISTSEFQWLSETSNPISIRNNPLPDDIAFWYSIEMVSVRYDTSGLASVPILLLVLDRKGKRSIIVLASFLFR
jgi:hypothetical protein